jgi:hypothetical protein
MSGARQGGSRRAPPGACPGSARARAIRSPRAQLLGTPASPARVGLGQEPPAAGGPPEPARHCPAAALERWPAGVLHARRRAAGRISGHGMGPGARDPRTALRQPSQRRKAVQSGDVVMRRINSGPSPHRHRTRMLSAEVVRTRINSGASPHHRIAPDFQRICPNTRGVK